MSNTNTIDEEEPLDPVMERVRKKMIRLLVISIGIMVIGLMAVLGAIVYKISNPTSPQEASSHPQTAGEVSGSQGTLAENIELELPDGAVILSTSMTDNRLLISVRLADGSPEFRVVDLTSGQVSNIRVKK